MKNIVIIGGSKGIGSAILLQQLETNIVYISSRNAPEITLTSNIFGRCFEEKHFLKLKR
jgi:NAD(P)-dependent dehydrogenase (short-subunit alcohol dehydrogenase family)